MPLDLRDYYGDLGVTRDASIDEIKLAYKKRMRATHPDLLGPDASELAILEANELIKVVHMAGEYLLDAQKKAVVDAGLRTQTASYWPSEEYDASSNSWHSTEYSWRTTYARPPREPIEVPEPESVLFGSVWCWVEYSAGWYSGMLAATVRVPLAELFDVGDLFDLPHRAMLTEVLAYDDKGEVVGREHSLQFLRYEVRKLQAQARRNSTRRIWREQVAQVDARYKTLTAQNKPTDHLQVLIFKATRNVESGQDSLRYAEHESTVVKSIREAQKEADRVETMDAAELLLTDLASGKIQHPHLSYNKDLLKKLDVYNFRTGGQFPIPSALDVREHYRRRIAGLTTQDEVREADLRLDDDTLTILELAKDGDLTLAPDTICVNGNKGPSPYTVKYGRGKLSGASVPVGMITVPEAVYVRNGAQHGCPSRFPALPHGITLVIRVKVRVKVGDQIQEILTDPCPDGKALRTEVKRCQARLKNPKVIEETVVSDFLVSFWEY